MRVFKTVKTFIRFLGDQTKKRTKKNSFLYLYIKLVLTFLIRLYKLESYLVKNVTHERMVSIKDCVSLFKIYRMRVSSTGLEFDF